MKKSILLILIAAGLSAILYSTITTIPSNAIVYIGTRIGFQTNCSDYYGSDTWYWGDGQTYKCVSDYPYSNVLYHNYRNPGNYVVQVHRSSSACVRDEFKNVTVLENRSIVASPAQPNPSQPITFTAINFQTPGDITWDMGDGIVYAHRTSVITHTFSKCGSYTIRAYDWNGNTSSTPVTLVLGILRGITFSPPFPRVDQPVDIQAVGFAPGPVDWNFGDGTPPLTASAAVSHRYQREGAFTITAVESGLSIAPERTAITVLPENRSLMLAAPEVRPDDPVVVQAINFRGELILWNFGDRTEVSGPATMTHVYKLPGNYTISARDENGASEKRIQTAVKVLGINDQVNLELAEITLGNGKYYQMVPRHSREIKALLRLKMRGTGIVSGYWIVDGQPFQFFNETVYQGQVRTIPTSEVPGLPAFDPGMHTVSMQLTRPAGGAAVFPTLRYFVLPYENEIEALAPRDGAVVKEEAAARFAWKEALGGSRYQIAFANGLFALLRGDASLAWRDCPERLGYTPDAGVWGAIRRNQWSYWQVRALDSSGTVVAASGIQEIKVVAQGAEVAIERVSDMDGNAIASGNGLALTRSGQVLIRGTVAYPADAEYLVLQIYANDEKLDQLLFRDVRKGEMRPFETSVPVPRGDTRVLFQVLKSSSPALVVGSAELSLKRE